MSCPGSFTAAIRGQPKGEKRLSPITGGTERVTGGRGERGVTGEEEGCRVTSDGSGDVPAEPCYCQPQSPAPRLLILG